MHLEVQGASILVTTISWTPSWVRVLGWMSTPFSSMSGIPPSMRKVEFFEYESLKSGNSEMRLKPSYYYEWQSLLQLVESVPISCTLTAQSSTPQWGQRKAQAGLLASHHTHLTHLQIEVYWTVKSSQGKFLQLTVCKKNTYIWYTRDLPGKCSGDKGVEKLQTLN